MQLSGIIDFHTHAFPDELAERAMAHLEKEGNVKAHLDGKISSLLESMDRNGIEKSVICSIATKPGQFQSILEWSKSIRTERIIPFPSIHPADKDFRERLRIVKEEGFKGIKLHPYYQNFYIDDSFLFLLYEGIIKNDLIAVMHTGYDFAFPRIPMADPEKILKVKERLPELKLVTTHLGSWDDWDNVDKYIIGKEIYMEISFSLEFLSRERARELIMRHPPQFILFGTDSPWTDQGKTLALLKGLELPEEIERAILRENALRLLG